MEFLCYSCSGSIDAGPEWAGQTTPCPHCGAELQVPGEAAPADPAAPAPVPAPGVPQQPVQPQVQPAAPAAPRLVVPATPPVAPRYAAPQQQQYAPPVQQQYAPAQAATPGYGQPYYGPQQTSGLAIASLVLLLLGALPPSIIFAHIARGQIKRDPTLKGAGLAMTTLVLGYGVIIIAGLLMIFVVFFASTTSSSVSMTKDLKAGKSIAGAIREYSLANDGDFPSTLDDLVPKYTERRYLTCKNADGDSVRFKYFPGYTRDSSAGILLASPVAVKGKRVVIMVNGSGYVMDDQEYREKVRRYGKNGI